jgi:Family of unknown function (DUF6282)
MSVHETAAVPDSRADEVAALLVGAVDLHCHSGPAAMPRVLDHHEAMMDCAAAGFRALLYKDHYYLGAPHAVILEKLFPDTGVRLFLGLVLNNANGGINPHAVDHAASIGAKIIWMPTVSAENHIAQLTGQGKTFPKTKRKMLDPIPLSALDANGAISDAAKACLDIIAEANIILAGGHLPARELHLLFDEARRRGVKKMLVNHPTYLVGCTDADIRSLVGLGAYMEHSICMFADGKSKKFDAGELAHLIDVAGVDRTILSSDLGLLDNPRPVEGFRQIVRMLLDLQFSPTDIRTLISTNAAGLLDLDVQHA